MTIEVVFVPEKKREEDVAHKIEKLVEDRNRVISKRFGMQKLESRIIMPSCGMISVRRASQIKSPPVIQIGYVPVRGCR